MTSAKQISLTLFFTQGISLRTWDSVGMLEREVAIYRALQNNGLDIRFITYGDRSDAAFVERLPGIEILYNRWGLPPSWYQRWLLWRLPAGATQIYKSNQVIFYCHHK